MGLSTIFKVAYPLPGRTHLPRISLYPEIRIRRLNSGSSSPKNLVASHSSTPWQHLALGNCPRLNRIPPSRLCPPFLSPRRFLPLPPPILPPRYCHLRALGRAVVLTPVPRRPHRIKSPSDPASQASARLTPNRSNGNRSYLSRRSFRSPLLISPVLQNLGMPHDRVR
jgi:hypothetical protein